MNKEKQIRKYENKQLIEESSKMPPMVIATAYLHAINYTLYSEDVTKKWLTATQNASALEKAYRKGFMDGVNDQAKRYKDSAYRQKHDEQIIEDERWKFAEWFAEIEKVSEPIKEYTINRWLEDFTDWRKKVEK